MMRATSKLLSTLWKSLSSSSQPATANTKLLMNTAWTGLEKAPQGSFKKKIYGVGLWLFSRVKPSELFVTGVEVTYPTSLNARLVRRRLRHIAMSGSVIHKKFPYGSASLLPVSVFNRTFSYWRAWQLLKFSGISLLFLHDDHGAIQQEQEDMDLLQEEEPMPLELISNEQGIANNEGKTGKKKPGKKTGTKKPKPPKIKIILYASYEDSNVRFNVPFACKTVRDLKALVANKLNLEEDFDLLFTDDYNKEIMIRGDDDLEVLVKMTRKKSPNTNTIAIKFK